MADVLHKVWTAKQLNSWLEDVADKRFRDWKTEDARGVAVVFVQVAMAGGEALDRFFATGSDESVKSLCSRGDLCPRFDVGASWLAAGAGNLESLKLLHRRYGRYGLFKMKDEGLPSMAAAFGHNNLLQYLLDNGCPTAEPGEWKRVAEAELAALRNGDPNKAVYRQCLALTSRFGLCEAAADSGQLMSLMTARRVGAKWDAGTCAAAARSGNLAVLQWARSFGCPWDRWTPASAAKKGHLAILEWAVSNGCPVDGVSYHWAARDGRLEVLQWLRLHKDSCRWDDSLVCWLAAANGHLEVLKWARSQAGCPWDKEQCLEAAKSSGHEEVCRWISMSLLEALSSLPDSYKAQTMLGDLCNRVDTWPELQVYFLSVGLAFKDKDITLAERNYYVEAALRTSASRVPVDDKAKVAFTRALEYALEQGMIDKDTSVELQSCATTCVVRNARFVKSIEERLRRNELATEHLTKAVSFLQSDMKTIASCVSALQKDMSTLAGCVDNVHKDLHNVKTTVARDMAAMADSVAGLRNAFVKKVRAEQNVGKLRMVIGAVGAFVPFLGLLDGAAALALNSGVLDSCMEKIVDFSSSDMLTSVFPDIGSSFDPAATLATLEGHLVDGEMHATVLTESAEFIGSWILESPSEKLVDHQEKAMTAMRLLGVSAITLSCSTTATLPQQPPPLPPSVGSSPSPYPAAAAVPLSAAYPPQQQATAGHPPCPSPYPPVGMPSWSPPPTLPTAEQTGGGGDLRTVLEENQLAHVHELLIEEGYSSLEALASHAEPKQDFMDMLKEIGIKRRFDRESLHRLAARRSPSGTLRESFSNLVIPANPCIV